jgi:hypothetical protein
VSRGQAKFTPLLCAGKHSSTQRRKGANLTNEWSQCFASLHLRIFASRFQSRISDHFRQNVDTFAGAPPLISRFDAGQVVPSAYVPLILDKPWPAGPPMAMELLYSAIEDGAIGVGIV